ncbi:class I SAM-dependent methyltransferase [Marinobacter sp. CHS3-4]|uniref:class I SAM-dependent methyltransferase n=1 Tax=Marinobacter sp. CHS3-4 TaxID=3045174 RepID=UPI0024B561F5|nr:class I SAM-dependent methyltransferase [Marinobacter sp. CHS3-4]MDI9246102.1 class I SAM-dependent methyltransferase [Marinobacter sp. CHS3-4]
MVSTSDFPGLATAHSPLGDSVQAQALAELLSIPFLGIVKPKQIRDFSTLLFSDDQGLCLQLTGKGAPGPVRAEFVSGKAGYRREHGGGTGQLIAKAVGLQKTRESIDVVDATAGLGQDAFVLASLGCRVRMFERSPIVHALLSDGLARASLNAACADILQNMTLESGDSREWLAGCEPGSVDVVYLDPMFPHRDKSALVKKEMQVFRQVVGDDADSAGLLEAALSAARYRVVVKRPRKAESLPGPAVTTKIEGKSSRYDVYALKALPSGD